MPRDDDAARTGGDGTGPRDGADSDRDRPVRQGTVDLRTRDGETVHHDDAFVRYDPDAFVVALDPSFPPDRTERYDKESVAWIEVRFPRR